MASTHQEGDALDPAEIAVTFLRLCILPSLRTVPGTRSAICSSVKSNSAYSKSGSLLPHLRSALTVMVLDASKNPDFILVQKGPQGHDIPVTKWLSINFAREENVNWPKGASISWKRQKSPKQGKGDRDKLLGSKGRAAEAGEGKEQQVRKECSGLGVSG